MHKLNEKQRASRHYANPYKLFVMIILLIADVGFNSSVDYDDYNNNRVHQIDVNLPIILLVLHLIIELSTSIALFLAMTDTFLFRVGLLGVLVKMFWIVLLSHPLYFSITLAEGAYRVNRLLDGSKVIDVWKDSTFVVLSISQKCGRSNCRHILR